MITETLKNSESVRSHNVDLNHGHFVWRSPQINLKKLKHVNWEDFENTSDVRCKHCKWWAKLYNKYWKTQINISAFVAVIKPDWQLFHTRIGVSVFKLRKKNDCGLMLLCETNQKSLKAELCIASCKHQLPSIFKGVCDLRICIF